MVKTVRVLLLLGVAAFAASLRAKPFAWEGSDAGSRVMESRALQGWHVFVTPESATDRLLAAVHARAGARGLSLLTLALFAAAAALSFDAARGIAGFTAASLGALLILPLGLGDSAPGPWLFSAFLAAAFLAVHVRARQGVWPPAAFFAWPAIAFLWPYVHRAGPVLAVVFALVCWWDAIIYRRRQDNSVEGGIYIAPADPLLFRADDVDMDSLHRVLRWETKVNQLLHQRLGLTAAQLPSLTAGRAAEVLNGLLDISDLPAQVGVPDPGAPDGNIRARNRRILDIQYKDALRLVARPSSEGVRGPAVERPLGLWAPTTAAILAALVALVAPTAVAALLRLGAAMTPVAVDLAAPASWWVWGPRSSAAALPYYWLSLGLAAAAAMAGFLRNRDQFSEALLCGALILAGGTVVFPGAAPFLAVALVPLAAAPLRGLWREDTPVRTLSASAAFIALLVVLFLADWDRMPLGAPLGLGAAGVQDTVDK